MEGIEIPVVAYSNCESIELFLNNKSLGKKEMGDNMDLVWNVPYEPGTLKALAKNNGKIVSEMEIFTAGEPAKIELLADRTKINAGGKDVVHFEVNVLDDKGNFVPDASNEIEFTVEGEGIIIGIDSGDPISLENFCASKRKAFNGKCLLIVKSTKKSGNIIVTAVSDNLETSRIELVTK